MTSTTLDGPDFQLSKYRGYAVWLNVFAAWCQPCRYEAPLVVRLAREYRARGLRVVGLFSLKGDTDDSVRRYRDRFGITYPLVRDKIGLVNALDRNGMGSNVFPCNFFITAWGNLWCARAGVLSEAEARYKIGVILSSVTFPLPPDPTAAAAPTATPASGPAHGSRR